MNRDESVKGCGQGDVCALLDTKGGKCTDINSVFVGLCRASGIPAREMFGVRINEQISQRISTAGQSSIFQDLAG